MIIIGLASALFLKRNLMKKLLLCLAPLGVAACSTPVQQSTVPMDMKTVYEYQQRVASGNTVDRNAKPDNEPLNQSDKHPRARYAPVVQQPVIYPSVGIGYYRGWGHHHHW